jgi:deoxyribodipyrimidine photolyase-related protein
LGIATLFNQFYPTNHAEAELWLTQFLEQRLVHFGEYEDAFSKDPNQHFLFHSVLSPLLNVGLLSPKQIIDQTLEYANNHEIPLNSLEGFIRQILGWREFIRVIYKREGSFQRNSNFWNFSRQIPPSFYTGNTGIEPIDNVIQKALKTSYSHHIERLMIVGNFFLLCEFNPNAVYQWFMEMYIDAYDWVMVPNIYGMSQFADGGLMTTKPYFSGSNYIVKMSDYKKGDGHWQVIWDALFWRFINRHRTFLQQNPRLGMLIITFDKMPTEKQDLHLSIAEDFLKKLDQEIQ